MDGIDLAKKLEEYPMWTQLDDPQVRSTATEIIANLSKAFQCSGPEERRAIAGELGRSAKHLMFQYSWSKAIEGRRTCSAATILEGLIPVVMAGGRAHTLAGGSLLSILLRSAVAVGPGAVEMFSYAAQFAVDEASAADIGGFPLLPPEQRDPARFGVLERRTKEGVIYEHEVESQFRRRWFDRFTGRRRPSREDVLNILRSVERKKGGDGK